MYKDCVSEGVRTRKKVGEKCFEDLATGSSFPVVSFTAMHGGAALGSTG